MDEYYENLRSQLRDRFIDYLKTDHVSFWPPALTICPQCGKHCGILLDREWRCDACGLSGDVVDYVMINNGFDTPERAIRHLCRMLGVKNTRLEVVTANEIMDMDLPDQYYVVEHFLAAGLTIFAGPSKIGKSWLVLWLAQRVSTGQTVWEFPSNPCEVLYLDLEDNYRRLQERLVDLTDGQAGPISIATEAEMIGNGLEEQITNFLRENPQTRLVIIDTLEMIRQMRAERNSYSGDYKTLTVLKGIGDRFNVSVLLVHHTKKEKTKDPFERVLGSVAHMGCSDNTYVLLPDDYVHDAATLYGKGRDIEYMELALRFNREDRCWEMVGNNMAQQEPSKHERVLLMVKALAEAEGEWEGTATELIQALEIEEEDMELTANVLVRILNANRAMLRNYYKVVYTQHRRNNSKILHLYTIPDIPGDADVYDMSDMIDISGNCEHTALIVQNEENS